LAIRRKKEVAMTDPHIGSPFDGFLAEEGILEAVAIKRILARQVREAMNAQRLTKKAMAERMGTSRSALDRLLDQHLGPPAHAPEGRIDRRAAAASRAGVVTVAQNPGPYRSCARTCGWTVPGAARGSSAAGPKSRRFRPSFRRQDFRT
jgi:hypothetical protein